jgi:hypothetical protein
MLHAQQETETQNSEHASLTVIASEAKQSIVAKKWIASAFALALRRT